MARIHEDLICPFCKERIKFIRNRPRKEIIGDAGGYHEAHSCKEGTAFGKRTRESLETKK